MFVLVRLMTRFARYPSSLPTSICLSYYRYLKVEIQHPAHGSRYREVLDAMKTKLKSTEYPVKFSKDAASLEASPSTPFKSIVTSVSKISSRVRGAEGSEGKQRMMWDLLIGMDEFIGGVLDIQQRCRNSRGKKDAKEVELKSLLAKEGFARSSKRLAVPLPSKPDLLVNGVHPDSAMMFKSALYPAMIEFNVEEVVQQVEGKAEEQASEKSNTMRSLLGSESKGPNNRCKVIVKTGDDLRQDQLVIMMIQLMDRLLRRAALDLCLTPYSIIATSPNSGLVEFVDKVLPISQVLARYNGSVMQYFQAVAPQKGAKYDIKPEALSTYIRSCAGYCVITYLLGVGDRHLDNILVRSTGHFLHIDFGFILGRDPKPLPPAFRLTREVRTHRSIPIHSSFTTLTHCFATSSRWSMEWGV